MSRKHKNYEILNLIGYGLAKFDNAFIQEFNCKTKTEFYNFCVTNKIADTVSIVKNRMDLFDPFFLGNNRKGWWQKGDAYIHRKILIDSLFGNEDVTEYANIVKQYFITDYKIQGFTTSVKPIAQTKFKKLQETGLQAELFFQSNYKSVILFQDAKLEDARLYGDGYDFQMTTDEQSYLAEVKGVRSQSGKFRLTYNEYQKAKDYQNDYIIAVVLNLDDQPKILTIPNPTKNLKFKEHITYNKEVKEYHLLGMVG